MSLLRVLCVISLLSCMSVVSVHATVGVSLFTDAACSVPNTPTSAVTGMTSGTCHQIIDTSYNSGYYHRLTCTATSIKYEYFYGSSSTCDGTPQFTITSNTVTSSCLGTVYSNGLFYGKSTFSIQAYCTDAKTYNDRVAVTVYPTDSTDCTGNTVTTQYQAPLGVCNAESNLYSATSNGATILYPGTTANTLISVSHLDYQCTASSWDQMRNTTIGQCESIYVSSNSRRYFKRSFPADLSPSIPRQAFPPAGADYTSTYQCSDYSACKNDCYITTVNRLGLCEDNSNSDERQSKQAVCTQDGKYVGSANFLGTTCSGTNYQSALKPSGTAYCSSGRYTACPAVVPAVGTMPPLPSISTAQYYSFSATGNCKTDIYSFTEATFHAPGCGPYALVWSSNSTHVWSATRSGAYYYSNTVACTAEQQADTTDPTYYPSDSCTSSGFFYSGLYSSSASTADNKFTISTGTATATSGRPPVSDVETSVALVTGDRYYYLLRSCVVNAVPNVPRSRIVITNTTEAYTVTFLPAVIPGEMTAVAAADMLRESVANRLRQKNGAMWCSDIVKGFLGGNVPATVGGTSLITIVFAIKISDAASSALKEQLAGELAKAAGIEPSRVECTEVKDTVSPTQSKFTFKIYPSTSSTAPTAQVAATTLSAKIVSPAGVPGEYARLASHDEPTIVSANSATGAVKVSFVTLMALALSAIALVIRM